MKLERGEFDSSLQTVVDSDGSLTGTAGAAIVRSEPLMVNENCVTRDNWNASVCQNSYGRVCQSYCDNN